MLSTPKALGRSKENIRANTSEGINRTKNDKENFFNKFCPLKLKLSFKFNTP